MYQEPLIQVTSCHWLDVKMQYPNMGFQCAEPNCYMRQAVFERLKEASNYLPKGLTIRVWDAWRPFALQKELYEKYAKMIVESAQLETTTKEEQLAEIEKFVSIPRRDEPNCPLHTTGGSVDVTLIDETGKEIPMGTSFDEFGEKSYTHFYEGTNEVELIENRNYLFNAMIKAGFTNLESEWWHYDYGNRAWAMRERKDILYSGILERN